VGQKIRNVSGSSQGINSETALRPAIVGIPVLVSESGPVSLIPGAAFPRIGFQVMWSITIKNLFSGP